MGNGPSWYLTITIPDDRLVYLNKWNEEFGYGFSLTILYITLTFSRNIPYEED